MKAYFYLILFLTCLLCVSAKPRTELDTCHDVRLKGYVIRQYKKSDIERLKSDTSKHVIDYYQRAYFLSIENNILKQSVLDSINILNSNEVYFLPSSQTNDLIIKYCGNNERKLFKGASNTDLDLTFFQIGKKQDAFLYKIYYSECRAIKSQIPNDSYNTFQLNISPDKKDKLLTCYFIYQHIILEEIKSIDSEDLIKVQW